MSRPVAAYRQYWRPTWSAARLTPFPSAESSGHEPCAMTQDMRRTESDTDAVRQGMKVQSESHEPAVAGADLAVARRVLDVEAREIDRTSVVEGKSVSVRVDLGGGRFIKKKKYMITYNQ